MTPTLSNAIPPKAEDAFESALDTARELVSDVADKVREFAPTTKAKRRRRGRGLVVVLVAVGVGAVVFAAARRRSHQVSPGPAPDAFGAAVTSSDAAQSSAR